MWYFQGFLDAIMVAFLFCGISLVDKFLDFFNVSYNASSAWVVD